MGWPNFNDRGTLDRHEAQIDWDDWAPPMTDGTFDTWADVTESPAGPPGNVAGTTGTVRNRTHVFAGDKPFYDVVVTVRDKAKTAVLDTGRVRVLTSFRLGGGPTST